MKEIKMKFMKKYMQNNFWNLLIIRCYVHKNLIITSNNREGNSTKLFANYIF